MIHRFCTLLFLVTFAGFAQAEFGSAERQQVITGLRDRLKPVMGDKWDTLYAKFQKPLTDASSKSDFYRVLRQMFADTGKSHFMVGAPDPRKLEAPEPDRSGSAGFETGLVDAELMVLSVEPGGAADKAGIKAGYVIESINGVSMNPFITSVQKSSDDPHRQRLNVKLKAAQWFAGPPGRQLELGVRDLDDGPSKISLVLQVFKGEMGSMGLLKNQPMAFESKRVANGTIGYVRFSIFLMPLLSKIRKAVSSFQDCKGIIMDVRGNLGGLGMMAMPIAGMFVDKQTSLGTSISGDDSLNYPVFPAPKPYSGKLVILTDEMSASTSEILAAGLQESGRAVVVGNQTMGAVLPSLIIKLENGATIQYPIGDFKTPKDISLEGRGVIPDHVVSFSREALKKANDIAIETAISIINKD